ncbi:MAG: tRNA (N6-threonylcarbamoyladenosine(37)-N6)-methyltransferase TrmO [Ignavibacteriaceae bacterium]
MKVNQIIYKPIGIVYSPFKSIEGVPIQPAGADGIKGKIKIYTKYSEGLMNLGGFSHIILIYHFHLSKGYSLKVIPFLKDQEQGVFATRAPKRPNQIGISVVKVNNIHENIIDISNVDIVDGTPLLDIKPYAGFFDNVKNEKNGWLSGKSRDVNKIKSDKRFL